jgi:hypothetical protein
VAGEKLKHRVGHTEKTVRGNLALTLKPNPQADGVTIDLTLPDDFNYARLSLPAAPDEAVYSGGMQFSHLNLRGRRFPIWTCEAGVGRNKRHLATILADLIAGAGGDYWTTYNPQPIFLSTRGAGSLLESDQYSLLAAILSMNKTVDVIFQKTPQNVAQVGKQ